MIVGLLAITGLAGCETAGEQGRLPLDAAPDVTDRPFVRDHIRIGGAYTIRVEGYGLVNGLDKTGSTNIPSSLRAQMLGRMKKLGVEDAGQVIDSPLTAVVLVRGRLLPGIRKGDRFDVTVTLPAGSDATSLAGGWLLETPLTEVTVDPDAGLLQGNTRAVASGPVFLDSSAEANTQLRGKILGGGVARVDREFLILIKPGSQSYKTSNWIAKRINGRFYELQGDQRVYVAKPKNDVVIRLTPHSRYQGDIPRFHKVIGALAMRSDTSHQGKLIEQLTQELKDPKRREQAALGLEAIGKPAADALARALDDRDEQVQFVAADALAFLNDPRCVPVLEEIARRRGPNRLQAIHALGMVDSARARVALRHLLDSNSTQARVKAFETLLDLDDRDVRGESVGDQFYLHVVESAGPRMVYVGTIQRPQITLFGKGIRLYSPLVLDVGQRMILAADREDTRCLIKRIDRQRGPIYKPCSLDLAEVIRTVGNLGASYPDTVAMLDQAFQNKNLLSPILVQQAEEPFAPRPAPRRGRDTLQRSPREEEAKQD